MSHIFFSREFWFELLILMLMPYPTMNNIVGEIQKLGTINWVDNSGQFPAHSHQYATEYYTADVMLSLMFLRLGFIVIAGLQSSPIIDFQGKRMCIERQI